MGNFFTFFERYKFGFLAAFALFIGIFMYLQIETYSRYFPIIPFGDEASVVLKEELELTPENLEIKPINPQGEVKNMARDQQDTRERSTQNYSQNRSASEVEQSVKDYEKQLFKETGGEGKRAKIMQEMADRKQQQQSAVNTASKNKATASQSGGNTAFSGNVMVDWLLTNRNPHQNNNWHVRNPGYTCGYGSSGRVTVQIMVSQGGDVLSAVYDVSRSSGATPCMIEQAVKYAKMSRFAYSGTAPKSQEGTISYTFISQ